MSEQTVRPDRIGVPRHHRTMFLSDLHLGAQGCRVDLVLAFLERNTADTIYLVGDILDIWHPISCWWTDAHDRIVRLIQSRALAGTRFIYLVGNHDHAMHAPANGSLLPVEIAAQITHVAADGRRYLVLHGDICDIRILRWHICTRIGSRLDGMLRIADRRLSALRRSVDPECRSPVEWLLSMVNALMCAGRRHERRLVALAGASGHDGVICGHFHVAALNDRHGLTYANCGDWVDSFTAIAESQDGRLSILGGRSQLRDFAGRPAAPDAAASPTVS